MAIHNYMTNRLRGIANQIEPGQVLVDIGTDHAYLPIYAVLTGLVKQAIAVDIHRPPLLAAQKNIKTFGLQNSIECRLGNGLQAISECEADRIVIAGMGGITMRTILEDGRMLAQKAHSLILQPNNHEGDLRKWLSLEGFHRVSEGIIYDRQHFYQWIKVMYTGQRSPIDSMDMAYGSIARETDHPVVRQWLTSEYNRVRIALQAMRNATIDVAEKRVEAEKILQFLAAILKK